MGILFCGTSSNSVLYMNAMVMTTLKPFFNWLPSSFGCIIPFKVWGGFIFPDNKLNKITCFYGLTCNFAVKSA